MPNSAYLLLRAASRAFFTAAWNAATFMMAWSEASTHMSPSGSFSLQYKAAAVIAGAVLRPIGSSMTGRCSLSIFLSCVFTSGRCFSLQITSGADTKSSPFMRSTVCCISVFSVSIIGRNCFGTSGVESGHRRVPEPPESITGNIKAILRYLLKLGNDGTNATAQDCVRRVKVQSQLEIKLPMKVLRTDLKLINFFHKEFA